MTHTAPEPTDAPASPSPNPVASEPAMFKNVLVGVDGTSAGRDAIALAETLRDHEGRLTLAHVVLGRTPVNQDFRSTPVERGSREILERERAAAGVSADLTGMVAPSVAIGLHRLAENHNADLLVVGSCRTRSIDRLLGGRRTQQALSGATCAVAVAPVGYAEAPKRIDTIGVAYSGTSESETALAVACAVASRRGAVVRTLTVVRRARAVWRYRHPLAPRWRRTDEPPEPAPGERPCSSTEVDGRVTIGAPSKQLLGFGDEVDLLVVGSRDRGPVRRLLLGSTSAHLARSAECPVLVLQLGSGPLPSERAPMTEPDRIQAVWTLAEERRR